MNPFWRYNMFQMGGSTTNEWWLVYKFLPGPFSVFPVRLTDDRVATRFTEILESLGNEDSDFVL